MALNKGKDGSDNIAVTGRLFYTGIQVGKKRVLVGINKSLHNNITVFIRISAQPRISAHLE